MGSLVCALASFLEARANKGLWLVRIEDIDPPREQTGADKLILNCLNAHGLVADGPVLYQSSRHSAYTQTLAELSDRKLCYRCNCTRAKIKAAGGRYDQHCRHHPPPPEQPCALRLNLQRAYQATSRKALDIFTDQTADTPLQIAEPNDDFVIYRKDGLFSYQLAVVVDDIAQGVTHVVRGSDLLSTTSSQRLLFSVLNHTPPQYTHLPIVTDHSGNKLSKQNHAPAVDPTNARNNLLSALHILGQAPPKPLQNASTIEQILIWGQEHWQLSKVPRGPVPITDRN